MTGGFAKSCFKPAVTNILAMRDAAFKCDICRVAGSEKMERVGGRQEKMEGHCSTGQSQQRAVVPMEEERRICRVECSTLFVIVRK